MRTLKNSSVSQRAIALAAASIVMSVAACSSVDDVDFDDVGNPFGGGSGAPSAGAPSDGGRGGSAAGAASAGRAGNPSSAGGVSGSSTASGSGGMSGSAGAGAASTPGAGTSSAGRGSGGRGSGGRSNGSSGAATVAGSAGTASTAGSGGSGGGCTQNLACKLAALPSTDDPAQDCVDRINQFRTQCACLPALARWTDGEACADQHAEYDSTRQAHSGFSDQICSSGGSAQNECPGWRSTNEVVSGCLQQMWNEGPPSENPCEDDCFQEHGHFINMSSTRYTKVACGFFTTSAGKVWAVQNFSR